MNNFLIQPSHPERGAALLTFVIFFLFASTILVLGFARTVYESITEARMLYEGKRSFFAGEAGLEDGIYRLKDGRSYSSTESFTMDGIPVTVFRVLVVDRYEYTASANSYGAARQSMAELVIGDGASFNFGLQTGNGGITFDNSSSVKGNVYSNGTVVGSGNMVYGDVVSAGSGGLVDGIHATGSVWAHAIDSSTVDKNAYYYNAGTLTGTVVTGTKYPGSTDQATATLPIPDSLIQEWKDGIESTGTTITSGSASCSTGTYTLPNNTTLNNVKIECNVKINSTVYVAGPVWIEGNLTFTNTTNMIASSSLGTKSVSVIVDNESNRSTSSIIDINNTATFASGNAQSYILLVSMNNSGESGGGTAAIDMGNSATGKLLAYAAHGIIDIGNSVQLKEVTAYRIILSNSAQVIYESGLMSLLFTSGPGGGFQIAEWEEI